MNLSFSIFTINNSAEFERIALEIYQFQLDKNPVYRKYCRLLKRQDVTEINEIPYLPISFFKSHNVVVEGNKIQKEFTSSGTTGSQTSSHFIKDLNVYNHSLDYSFEKTYGDQNDYVILALLPHYLERSGSSLVYMVQRWIEKSNEPASGFYLNNLEELASNLQSLRKAGKKVILIGVTFALLELADRFPIEMESLTIIETGGMKGMRKEIIKQELHKILKKSFPKSSIQSEYGMTELLSQAYAKDGVHFETPPWMSVSARDTNDPLSNVAHGKTGGLNVIDLANYNSCSFIATQDLCKTHANGTFEVLGRFDQSDIRGCNLMAVPN